MMKFDVQQHGNVVVVAVSGDVMGGPGGSQFHEKLTVLRGAGSSSVVADLAGVQLMNSSGLGMLIGALTTMRNAGGDLRLACLTDRVKSLLTITKLVDVFATFESVDEAVASFN